MVSFHKKPARRKRRELAGRSGERTACPERQSNGRLACGHDAIVIANVFSFSKRMGVSLNNFS
jgi:hypothetical protein